MIRKAVKTRRLVLRPLKQGDYYVWREALTEGLVKQNKWDLEPRKLRDCNQQRFKKIIREHARLAKIDDYYRYYAFEKATGKLIGHIDFDVFVRGTHQFANFGYQIYNRYWRKGYGKEAARAGLKIGFQQLHLNRLEAAINLDNRTSIKLARSIGMRREGVKKRYWFEYGRWTDHLIYVANPEDIGLRGKKPKII
jgi:ribosomal-protein-alanine N-acetyltransferase